MYYFWGHSDVVIFPQNTTTSFAEVAVACAEAAMSSRPKWGIMYFMYDWFSAIRTDLVRQVSFFVFFQVSPVNLLKCSHQMSMQRSHHVIIIIIIETEA